MPEEEAIPLTLILSLKGRGDNIKSPVAHPDAAG